MYANSAVRIAITFAEAFPVGLVISVISADLLSNSRFVLAQAVA